MGVGGRQNVKMRGKRKGKKGRWKEGKKWKNRRGDREEEHAGIGPIIPDPIRYHGQREWMTNFSSPKSKSNRTDCVYLFVCLCIRECVRTCACVFGRGVRRCPCSCPCACVCVFTKERKKEKEKNKTNNRRGQASI